MAEQLYAVYPGTVTLQDGVTTKTWTAVDLAAAYGVAAEPYLVINNPLQIPQGEAYFKYIHLVPRGDDIYQNIMYTAEDDGQNVAYRPDFDATKKYTMETDPLHIYPDEENEKKLYDDIGD